MEDLHDALRSLDPVRWRSEMAAAMRERLQRLHDEMVALGASATPEAKTLGERLIAFAALLKAQLPLLPESGSGERWATVRQRLQPAYEELVETLRGHAVRVPSLRPTNYARNFFHVLNGIVVIAVVELFPQQYILWPASCALATVWLLETTRRVSPRWNDKIMALFGPVAHPYEIYRVNSGTWFVTALFVLALTGRPVLGAVGVAILGFADPAAALIGRRFGRTPLVNGRTLEGSAAFFVVATLVSVTVLAWLHTDLAGGAYRWAVAAAAALVATLVELFSRRIDDNLSIPLSAAAVVALMLY